jgi:hypothetical protein
MAQKGSKGSRSRSQSAGRGWNEHLMDAVAVQIANSFQFGSGGKGRRGETFQGKGKGASTLTYSTKQEDNPDDWFCQDCGLKVWARKRDCPKCASTRADRTPEVKEQINLPGSTSTATQQPVGTEGDTDKAEEAKKRAQLKHLAKTIAGWPEDNRDSAIYRSIQKEAEDLKLALTTSQPTDMQLLGAKEEVNATRRRIIKSEKKVLVATKDLTTAKDEVAASRASNTSAVERLEALEKAIKALSAEHPEETIVTNDEREVLRQMRDIRSGKAGPAERAAYQQSMAVLFHEGAGHPEGAIPTRKMAPVTPQGAPATPGRKETPVTPQGTPAGAAPLSPSPLKLAPAEGDAQGGKKRGAAEDADVFQREQELARTGVAMEQEAFAAAAPVPGAMTQPEAQAPKPMELDGVDGSPFSPEEQEQWDELERVRAADLGRELAASLTTAKEEAAAKEASRDAGSPGKARTPKQEKMARRLAGRSPYKKREDEEGDSPSLPSVTEEADASKAPSEGEGEDAEDPDPPEEAAPEGA